MPFLMHVCFDNTSRLTRNVHYFEYNGHRFKLIQNNPRKWRDVLLTIVPHNDRPAEQFAYAAAGEFLSALSWQNHSRVALEHGGGMGVPSGYTLRNAKCRVFTFPDVPFPGHHVGFTIDVIPHVETEDQRLALGLFREAHACNNVFLSFLFYWNVMQVANGNPYNWVTAAYRRHRNRIAVSPNDISQLPLNGKKLGEYLYQDCRCAIAHVYPRKGRRLKLDAVEESQRLNISTRIVEAFARFYIVNKLKLRKQRYLTKDQTHKFPTFVAG